MKRILGMTAIAVLLCAQAYGQFGTYFLNNSGGEIPQYSPVVIDTGEDNAITLSASAAELFVVGVAAEDIAVGVTGIVTLSGSISVVNTLGTVDRGDPLVTSETPGYARAYSDYTEADAIFGVALTAAEAVEGEGEAGEDTVEVLLLSAYALQRLVDDGLVLTADALPHLQSLLDVDSANAAGYMLVSDGEGEGEAEWVPTDMTHLGDLLDPTIPETADRFIVSTGEGESEWQETSLSDTTAKIFGEGTTALTLPAGSAGATSLNLGTAGTGAYSTGTNNFSISSNAVQTVSVTPNQLYVNGQIVSVRSGSQNALQLYGYQNSGAMVANNFYCARGTVDVPAYVQSGDIMGILYNRSWATASTYNICGQLFFQATEAHSETAAGTRLKIYTTPNLSTTAALAVTVEEDAEVVFEGNTYVKGNVGIGMPSGAYDLDVSGNMRASGNIVSTGGALLLPVTNALYFGDNNTDGSWRMMVSGGNFVIQYRTGGSWNTKETIVP